MIFWKKYNEAQIWMNVSKFRHIINNHNILPFSSRSLFKRRIHLEDLTTVPFLQSHYCHKVSLFGGTFTDGFLSFVQISCVNIHLVEGIEKRNENSWLIGKNKMDGMTSFLFFSPKIIFTMCSFGNFWKGNIFLSYLWTVRMYYSGTGIVPWYRWLILFHKQKYSTHFRQNFVIMHNRSNLTWVTGKINS